MMHVTACTEPSLKMRMPRSFTLRILGIGFVGTHIPLVGTSIYALSALNGGLMAHSGIMATVLVSTLLGTVITLLAIHKVLRPVALSAAALKAYTTRREMPDLPLDQTDELGELMATVRTVCERLENELRQQERLASSDPLTGLPNRRAFFNNSVALLNTRRSSGGPAALAMLDLDHFKSLNDTYGHPAGDEALRAFARLIADETPAGATSGRLGGEEFGILFDGDAETALVTLERIRCRTAQLDLDLDPPRHLTVSIGLTEVDACEEAIISPVVLERADRALYEAKEAGRNRICRAE